MRWRWIAALALAGALGAGLAPQPVQAQSTCVTPSYVRLPVNRVGPISLTFRWLVPAVSDGGALSDPDTGTQLLALGPLPAGPTTETIVLPPSAVQQALQSGAPNLNLIRIYSDPAPTIPRICFAQISFAGPLGTALGISRIQLRFDAGSPLRIVGRDDELVAWADLVYQGGGEIVARWEVAGPESSSGTPVFVVIDRVRRHLEGGGRVSLASPPLPTHVTGLSLVRLVIESPRLDFTEPDLRYYVGEGAGSRPQVIAVQAPANQAELAADTTFRWQTIPEASAYRVEFHRHDPTGRPHLRFDRENPSFAARRSPGVERRVHEAFGPTAVPPPADLPPGPPVAGLLVAGDAGEASLSAWARQQLEPGQTYVWVVRGLASAGIPVAISAPRLLHVPAGP